IFITSSIGYKMVYALRRELFAHLQRLSLSFHNHARSGDLMTRIAGDTNTLKDVFAESILKFASQTLEIVGMFAIMFALNWKVSLISLATMPFLCFSLFHLYRKTKASVKKQKRQEGKVASRMTEVLSAIPLVQAFAREKYEEEQFDAVTAETLQESIRVARLEAAATRSSQIVTALGTATAVLFGALQVLHGKMLPGELVLVVAYLNNLYKPLRGMAKLSTDFSKAMASADRISEVLDLEPEIQDRPDAVEAARLKGEIIFQNVSFDYGDGKDVLRHISFSASPGQSLAVVYAPVIGERDATLYGGQRQRIAIARAVIRNAPILILDEPMTGLDVESEAKVREALDRLMTGRTCLMITHDLQSIAHADLV